MPTANINGVSLYYEEHGEGIPLIFIHEFAGDYRSWLPQVRHFARRYRTITYNARGYPPSDVPQDPAAYSQDIAVADLVGLMDHLGIDKAHVVGFSMGGSAALIFGVRHAERARSLVIAGTGSGSSGKKEDFIRDVEYVANRFFNEGMDTVADFYTRGPNRVQFEEKDPLGWQEFYDNFRGSSAQGHGLTMLGVQRNRPSVHDLEAELKQMTIPSLIIVGDEDEPCLEPGLFLKRTIPSAALVTFPKTGHTLNLEEPELFNRTVQDFLGQVDAGRWTLRNPKSLSRSAVLSPDEAAHADK